MSILWMSPSRIRLRPLWPQWLCQRSNQTFSFMMMLAILRPTSRKNANPASAWSAPSSLSSTMWLMNFTESTINVPRKNWPQERRPGWRECEPICRKFSTLGSAERISSWTPWIATATGSGCKRPLPSGMQILETYPNTSPRDPRLPHASVKTQRHRSE